MNAIPLFTKEGNATSVSYCAKCKIPAPHDLAEACCTTSVCEVCGKDTGYRSMKVCSGCRDKRAMERAEKLENWTGPVVFNDHYYDSLDDMMDCNEGEAPPEFVYVAETEHFPKIDIEDFLQNYCEDLFEEAEEHLEGVKDLADAFKMFNEANAHNTYWMESTKRAVRVPVEDTFPSPALSGPEKV